MALETMVKNEVHNEKDICLRIANGDEHAFTIIVSRYWKNIYSQSLAYLKSSQAAEEVTQDVFLRLWLSREKLPGIENLSAYLHVVCRNVLLNALRKKLKNQTKDLSDDLLEEALQPDKQLEYREYYEAMLFNIELLPEMRRQVFKMSRLEGKTHEEIANILGLHKDTVAQYIVKALNFLRMRLRSAGDDALLITLVLIIPEFYK